MEINLLTTVSRTINKSNLKKQALTIHYIVYSSLWKEHEFSSRMNAISHTWATKIQPLDTITYIQTTTIRYMDQSENASFYIPPYNNKSSPVVSYLIHANKTKSLDKDWYYIAADASYVIPNKLSEFLMPLDPSIPYYLGHPLHLPTEGKYSWKHLNHLLFNSLVGTVLSRRSVEILIEGLHSGCHKRCKRCKEDLFIAFCLRENGIIPLDTRDHFHQDRFHIFQPGSLMNTPRQTPHDYSPKNTEWYQLYNLWPIQLNLKCCSSATIMFHYVDGKEMFAIHEMLYSIQKQLQHQLNQKYNDTEALKYMHGTVDKFMNHYLDPKHEMLRYFLLAHIQMNKINHEKSKSNVLPIVIDWKRNHVKASLID